MAVLTPSERRERLQQFMAKHVLKAKPWAERAGINPNILYNFLKKRSASISQKAIEKLAEAANVEPWDLFRGSQEIDNSDIIRVKVRGQVQSGAWLENIKWPESKQYEITLPNTGADDTKVFGLLVNDPSMNREHPEGTILVCAEVGDLDEGPKSGDHVIVAKTAGDLTELTCRELIIESDKAWLWSRSTDPEHQSAIPCALPHEDEKTERDTVISAVVVGSYRPRNR